MDRMLQEAAGKADVEAKAGAAAKAREKEVALRHRLNEVERLLATAHGNDEGEAVAETKAVLSTTAP